MPIRINLKEIFSSDPQEIVVSKLNFNYNKLLELGVGQPGPIGVTGPQGPAGPIGLIGPQGDRGATWWVDSGNPNTLTFSGLIDGDLYLDQDSTAFQVYKYDESSSTWMPIVSIADIVNSYLNVNSTIPFESSPITVSSPQPQSNQFIVFKDRDNPTDATRGTLNVSKNNILFLNNFDETAISGFGQSQYNSLLAIFAAHEDSSPSTKADIGRYHFELGSLYDNGGTPEFSQLKHNLKGKFYKDYKISPTLSNTNQWINTAKFSLSIPELVAPSEIDENAQFDFVIPKWNNEGVSPVRDEITVSFASAEAIIEKGVNFSNVVSDGIIISNNINRNIAIGLAQNYSSPFSKLNSYNHLLLDGNLGTGGRILLNKGVWINGDVNIRTGLAIGEVYANSTAPANSLIVQNTIGVSLSSPSLDSKIHTRIINADLFGETKTGIINDYINIEFGDITGILNNFDNIDQALDITGIKNIFDGLLAPPVLKPVLGVQNLFQDINLSGSNTYGLIVSNSTQFNNIRKTSSLAESSTLYKDLGSGVILGEAPIIWNNVLRFESLSGQTNKIYSFSETLINFSNSQNEFSDGGFTGYNIDFGTSNNAFTAVSPSTNSNITGINIDHKASLNLLQGDYKGFNLKIDKSAVGLTSGLLIIGANRNVAGLDFNLAPNFAFAVTGSKLIGTKVHLIDYTPRADSTSAGTQVKGSDIKIQPISTSTNMYDIYGVDIDINAITSGGPNAIIYGTKIKLSGTLPLNSYGLKIERTGGTVSGGKVWGLHVTGVTDNLIEGKLAINGSIEGKLTINGSENNTNIVAINTDSVSNFTPIPVTSNNDMFASGSVTLTNASSTVWCTYQWIRVGNMVFLNGKINNNLDVPFNTARFPAPLQGAGTIDPQGTVVATSVPVSGAELTGRAVSAGPGTYFIDLIRTGKTNADLGNDWNGANISFSLSYRIN
jgi:hypothetical protein